MREQAGDLLHYNELPDKAWKSSPVWPLVNEARTSFHPMRALWLRRADGVSR